MLETTLTTTLESHDMWISSWNLGHWSWLGLEEKINDLEHELAGSSLLVYLPGIWNPAQKAKPGNLNLFLRILPFLPLFSLHFTQGKKGKIHAEKGLDYQILPYRLRTIGTGKIANYLSDQSLDFNYLNKSPNHLSKPDVCHLFPNHLSKPVVCHRALSWKTLLPP